ncbi:hypothetical protein [Halomarina litorea]|uniref:hypothetical protein n=1 Tax=Halomarina litorea TaxID=2961595 RepID=UPI0020C1C904|nr:hypothetical protein [Halomarina sp. BCD28]
MGRTNPTFRDQLREYEDYWQAYRRALRRRGQPHFDRLFEHAAAHADAAGALNDSEPLYPILVSIALEHERRIEELEERFDEEGEQEVRMPH